MKCKHEYEFNEYCGAYVCIKCGDHKDLSCCFCGWNITKIDPNDPAFDDY